MHFTQYYLACLSQASYLIGDTTTGRAVVVDPRQPVVLVGDEAAVAEAKLRMGRIGYDRVVGALVDLESAMIADPDQVDRASQLTAVALREAREAGQAMALIDIRNPGEVNLGTIQGAEHIPLAHLRDRLDELDLATPTVVFCAGGYRSSIAASLLRSAGFADVSDLLGGYGAWTVMDQPASPVA